MKTLLVSIFLLFGFKIHSQCVTNLANIYTFTVNDVPYELIKEKKSWVDASACAVSRGGKLAEIHSKAEQDSVYKYVSMAGIVAASTRAPDGGNASYVWLGGNDIQSEGNWFWDGADMGSFDQFWQGTSTGSSPNNSYSNWGNEPDDFNNQDALGLAITNWMFGAAGQWNDVNADNQLYYIIEYPMLVIATALPELKTLPVSVYPNPVEDVLHIKTGRIHSTYELIDQLGITVMKGTLNAHEAEISVSHLSQGIYMLVLNGQMFSVIKK